MQIYIILLGKQIKVRLSDVEIKWELEVSWNFFFIFSLIKSHGKLEGEEVFLTLMHHVVAWNKTASIVEKYVFYLSILQTETLMGIKQGILQLM